MPDHRTLIVAPLLALATFIPLAAAAVEDVPPNVLLIIGDDIGVANIGAYVAGGDGVPGDPPPTPTIDGLAENGVLFRRAWVAPQCAPTRAGCTGA